MAKKHSDMNLKHVISGSWMCMNPERTANPPSSPHGITLIKVLQEVQYFKEEIKYKEGWLVVVIFG